jgi:hypothetical protein
MSVTFSTGFHIIKPGLRVSGDEISVVFVSTYDSGIYAGKKYIHIDLTNEPDLTFVEAGVSGPLETVADVDALYTQLKDAGMTEAFDGFLVDPSDLSSISVGAEQISFDFAGHQPYIFSRNPDPAATERTKVAHQTWSLPQADFSVSGDLFGALESPEEVEFVSIENRLALLEATNGLIKEDYNFITLVGSATPDPGQVGINAIAPSAVEMIVLPNVDVDGKTLNYGDFKAGDRMGLKQANGSAAIYSLQPQIALGDHFRFNVELLTLGYYEDQNFVLNAPVSAVIEDTSTRTSAAAVMGVGVGDTDLGTFIGATVADGATAKEALQALESGLETTISSLASEVSTREAADTALDGRVTALEADPTTAAAVAAGDAATLSSANTYTDTSITNLVNGADAALDTLKEIGDVLAQGDSDVTAALTAQITTESTTRSTADAALSGRLDTLEADPTTQTALDAEVTARTTADSALDGRVATLEGSAAITDPTTATAVAAVQSDVDANQTASESADSALSGRLDVLEADPTTATAVAAVQADVDQNESDADAALALKAPLADPDFTGQLDVGTNARIEFADNLTKIHNVLRGTSINIGNNIEVKPAAAGGRVEITGDLLIDASDFVDAANDTAAAAAGVVVGQVYRNGSDLKVRVS